jgi:hypothetical protein
MGGEKELPFSRDNSSSDRVGSLPYRLQPDDELADVRVTKLSLERRGFTVVITSVVLAVLLFGLAAFVRRHRIPPWPHPKRGCSGQGACCARGALVVGKFEPRRVRSALRTTASRGQLHVRSYNR